MKPRITIDLATKPDGKNFLPVLEIELSATFQEKYDLRPPLGVYNISMSQLATRIARCANKLEIMLRRCKSPSEFIDDIENQLLSDHLLLVIYAAAEHVDDLESALLTFFATREQFARSMIVRKFKKDLSRIRRRMSGFANALKHQQARIRTHVIGFEHENEPMCLTGFFIEGVQNGIVGPSRIFHEDEAIISIPSFLWETIYFAFEAAMLLEDAAIHLMDAKREHTKVWQDMSGGPVLALARVPNFSFDGPHPFERTTLVLENVPRQDSQDELLYGSLFNPWSKSNAHAFHGMMSSFEGDGATKSFSLAGPSQVRLQHWD